MQLRDGSSSSELWTLQATDAPSPGRPLRDWQMEGGADLRLLLSLQRSSQGRLSCPFPSWLLPLLTLSHTLRTASWWVCPAWPSAPVWTGLHHQCGYLKSSLNSFLVSADLLSPPFPSTSSQVPKDRILLMSKCHLVKITLTS